MRTKLLYLILFAVIIYSCTGNSNKIGQGSSPIDKHKKECLWTDSLKSIFSNKYSKTDYERFALASYITDNELVITDSILVNSVKEGIPDSILSIYFRNYPVDMQLIANKSKTEIEKILGLPSKKECINPSGIGTCDKFTYLGSVVEIVFIKGKSDWITVNNSPLYTIIKNPTDYISINSFEDYTYVKVKTN